MDILAGIRDKLRFIERFYLSASGPFRDTKRKIATHEEPFVPPSFDPDTATDFEPPFLEEWLEADESLNLVGQAALNLAQAAFRDYLNWFLKLNGVNLQRAGAIGLSGTKTNFWKPTALTGIKDRSRLTNWKRSI